MKKFLALTIAVCLLFCACTAAPAPTAEPTTEPSTQPTEPPTEPLLSAQQMLDAVLTHAQLKADAVTITKSEFADEAANIYAINFDSQTHRYFYTVDAKTGSLLTYAQERIEPAFRHPLTGAPLTEPYKGRATAVVINNLKAALPHHGVSQADILYELETEGGITRFLAIFTDLSDVADIGPVRSARTFFNSIALSYDAPIIHCGGSERGIRGYHNDSGSKISNWAHINEQSNGSYFFRNYDRYNSGMAWEHTLFTNGEKLLKGLAAKGYDTQNELDFGLQFSEDIALNGEVATTVTAHFRKDKTTTFTYDESTGLYRAAQYGKDYIDGNTKEVMTFRNVLVLVTDQWMIADSYYYRSYYDLITSGDGYFACNGEIIPIKWSRDELRGSFCYTLTDGTPLTLGVGTTYIGILENKTPVTYE